MREKSWYRPIGGIERVVIKGMIDGVTDFIASGDRTGIWPEI
jgi:hypothetical protein